MFSVFPRKCQAVTLAVFYSFSHYPLSSFPFLARKEKCLKSTDRSSEVKVHVQKKRACRGVPNFPDCKGFSENAAHVCACLLCANGKASLGGMLQAAFLKANRNSAMWESPTLSQANEKPKIRIRCKREVPANCFSLHMEQEGLEAELRIPPNGQELWLPGCFHHSACTGSQLQPSLQ